MEHWVKRLTEKFLEQYPEERYGKAHAILDDDNYNTHFIQSALKSQLPLHTRLYLEWLLTIPEQLRDPYYYGEQWEDDTFPSSWLG